jgi:serine/threonine protein kinase/Tol biopolymer transport system component
MSMIGKTLAHYEITSQLGKGGMGEVYQAKDKKLGRDVAIKVLPEEFARDTERVARFQREAKLLASLNHPNIAAIHGLEEAEGTNFLVLELVEGETLADRIKAGPIPVEESLKLALQIAEALEAAHEKGVIHRDLKPLNIKVTHDGKIKVLDFGLAKAFAGEQAELNLSNSPTLSNAATQQGVILGTAAYMSPEQARGESVDKKADIWAFGCVLFEMLTGRAAFEGRTVSDVLASVIKSEPVWNRLPPNLSPRIRLLLERCLEKEARNRCSSMGEARADIQKDLADFQGVFAQPVPAAKSLSRSRSFSWIAAAVVLTAIVAGVAVWKLKPSESRQVIRLDHELPPDQQFGKARGLVLPVLAISPDGRQFVYSTNKGLYLRSINELTARHVAGTDGDAQQPFFSPDGQWIGYWSAAKSQLNKIVVAGGAPVVLCDVGFFYGASWNADDTITYGQFGRGIMKVSAKGGSPESLMATGIRPVGFPQILPDGRSVLFTLSEAPTRIMVHSYKSGESKELLKGDTARYLPTGHIIYAKGNNLFAVRFDVHKLEVSGTGVPVLEGVLRTGEGISLYAVSDSGTLVYVPGTAVVPASGRTLVWVDRNGKEEPLTAPTNTYYSPRISPDGAKVALGFSAEANTDIWIWDLVRVAMIRLTLDPGADVAPVWTPDGKRIVFCSNRKDSGSLHWRAADGTGKDEPLGSPPGRILMPASWSQDGKTLVVVEGTPALEFDIGVLSMESGRSYKPLLKEKYNEYQPRISPDGRWMAYASNESGRIEVYVRPFPDVDKGRWQVSTSGGNSPLWSRDGRELFYFSDGSVMAVTVKTEPNFSPGTARTLFRGTYEGPYLNSSASWDLSPDGKRFLMMKEVSAASPAEGPRKINIVVNWFEELKQRVPVK